VTKLRGLSAGASYTDRATPRLSTKLVPTFFVDSRFHLVSVTDPYDRILGFLDWSRYEFTHNMRFLTFAT
jgi:hypothetical protein